MPKILTITLLLATVLPSPTAFADDPGPAPMATMERQFMKAIPNVAAEKRREFIGGFFSVYEHRHLYGPDLAKAFDIIRTVSPDQLGQAVVKALEGIIKKYGCGEIFEHMSHMGPVMRAYEFAAACPPKGDRAVEPDLAANTPLAFVLVAAMMEAYARDEGFDNTPLHQSAMGLFLNPRAWLDSPFVTITITTDAIWVDATRAVHLTCKGDPDNNTNRCKRHLRTCAREPASEQCGKTHMTLEPAGSKGEEFAIAKLVEVVKKSVARIRQNQEKLERDHELIFVLFTDQATPYQLVTRTVYSALAALPEKDRKNARIEFQTRPPTDGPSP